MPAKSSRVGRVNRKPTDERRAFDTRVITSKARVTTINRERGRLVIDVVTPTGRPRSLPITFGA